MNDGGMLWRWRDPYEDRRLYLVSSDRDLTRPLDSSFEKMGTLAAYLGVEELTMQERAARVAEGFASVQDQHTKNHEHQGEYDVAARSTHAAYIARLIAAKIRSLA